MSNPVPWPGFFPLTKPQWTVIDSLMSKDLFLCSRDGCPPNPEP
uniref:Uncharacterized protein n=1 Tax=Arundo donax TaxID=35708 RepID=A0A0A9EQX2_ARUDO